MIHIANAQGKKSKHKHRLGAVVVKSGNVVATGYNKIGHRAKGITETELKASVHAERAAITKLLKPKHFHKLQGAKIYVSRIMKDGSFGLAHPCKHCLELIKSCGIKEVIFTNGKGTISRKRI